MLLLSFDGAVSVNCFLSLCGTDNVLRSFQFLSNWNILWNILNSSNVDTYLTWVFLYIIITVIISKKYTPKIFQLGCCERGLGIDHNIYLSKPLKNTGKGGLLRK